MMATTDPPAPASPVRQTKAPKYADKLKGLSPVKLLHRLESKECRKLMAPDLRRSWLKAAKKTVRRVRCRSRSIVWYEDVALYQTEPCLPDGEPCGCAKCNNGRDRTLWPGYYMRDTQIRVDGKRVRVEMSYECFLDNESEWFRRSLPSSSSVVRMSEI